MWAALLFHRVAGRPRCWRRPTLAERAKKAVWANGRDDFRACEVVEIGITHFPEEAPPALSTVERIRGTRLVEGIRQPGELLRHGAIVPLLDPSNNPGLLLLLQLPKEAVVDRERSLFLSGEHNGLIQRVSARVEEEHVVFHVQ